MARNIQQNYAFGKGLPQVSSAEVKKMAGAAATAENGLLTAAGRHVSGMDGMIVSTPEEDNGNTDQ